MTEPYDKGRVSPWGLFRGDDIYWLGMAENEADAWKIGLGWPDREEIAEAKAKGIDAVPVSLVPRRKPNPDTATDIAETSDLPTLLDGATPGPFGLLHMPDGSVEVTAGGESFAAFYPVDISGTEHVAAANAHLFRSAPQIAAALTKAKSVNARLERTVAQMREDFRHIRKTAEQHCPVDGSVVEW